MVFLTPTVFTAADRNPPRGSASGSCIRAESPAVAAPRDLSKRCQAREVGAYIACRKWLKGRGNARVYLADDLVDGGLPFLEDGQDLPISFGPVGKVFPDLRPSIRNQRPVAGQDHPGIQREHAAERLEIALQGVGCLIQDDGPSPRNEIARQEHAVGGDPECEMVPGVARGLQDGDRYIPHLQEGAVVEWAVDPRQGGMAKDRGADAFP